MRHKSAKQLHKCASKSFNWKQSFKSCSSNTCRAQCPSKGLLFHADLSFVSLQRGSVFCHLLTYPLARLWPDRLETDRQTNNVWDNEWRTNLQDSKSSHTHCQPSPAHCRAPYISACLSARISSLLSFSFCAVYVCLSAVRPHYVSVAILVLVCIAQHVYIMCREALVPRSHISSLKPLHSLPLIKFQMTQAITLNTVT